MDSHHAVRPARCTADLHRVQIISYVLIEVSLTRIRQQPARRWRSHEELTRPYSGYYVSCIARDVSVGAADSMSRPDRVQ